MTDTTNAAPGDQLASELAELWSQYLPLTQQRIGIIRAAAVAGSASDDELETVRVAAHALMGALGLYGLQHGAAIAREVERMAGERAYDAQLLDTAAAALDDLVNRPVCLTTP
ncbi:MAG: Hpt domain-containing protein [Actinomycetota bacterium]